MTIPARVRCWRCWQTCCHCAPAAYAPYRLPTKTSATATDDQHSRRYEDNFDPVTNLTVMVMNTDKTSVTGWGSPQKFLDQHRYLLGEQVFIGEIHPVSLPAILHGQVASQCIPVRENRG